MSLKITPAQRRALQAVKDGAVFRNYNEKGNTLHGPAGMSATTLWKLSRAGLIADTPAKGGHRNVFQVLTKRGQAALDADD